MSDNFEPKDEDQKKATADLGEDEGAAGPSFTPRGGAIPKRKNEDEDELIPPPCKNIKKQEPDIVDLTDDEDPDENNNDDDIQLECIRKKDNSTQMPKAASWIADTMGQVDPQEQSGYIKEYINLEGQGVIFSHSVGLVFFHLKHGYIDGKRIPDVKEAMKKKFAPGTDVKFLESAYKSDEFKVLSKEKFIRQASAVWIDTKPPTVLKDVKKIIHQDEMRKDREQLKTIAQKGDFLPLDIVRGRGMITGLLSEEFGLLETQDDPEYHKEKTRREPRTLMVVFKVFDVHMNQVSLEKNIKHAPPVQNLLAPGLRCYFDAREIKPFRGITFQATSVFVSKWPKTPHPTLLPAAEQCLTPCYNIPLRMSFYYLDLFKRSELDREMYSFRQHVTVKGNSMMKSEMNIDSPDDFYTWQERYCPGKIEEKKGGGYRGQRTKREILSEFKEARAYIQPFEDNIDHVKLERMEKEGFMRDPTLKAVKVENGQAKKDENGKVKKSTPPKTMK